MAAGQPIHASAFAYDGVGCLVLGESGTGKSAVVAQATMLGGQLVADDQVVLTAVAGRLMAEPVPSLRGVLELRGIGLISHPLAVLPCPIGLVVTLAQGVELARLPEPHTQDFEGLALPHLWLPPMPQTPVASLLLYLKAMQEGRILPTDWHPRCQ